jgi:hypothetical protein
MTGKIGMTLSGVIDQIDALVYSPDGQVLIAGDNRGRLVFFDRCTGKEFINLALPCSDITSLAFTPDGKTLYAVCKVEDRTQLLAFRSLDDGP